MKGMSRPLGPLLLSPCRIANPLRGSQKFRETAKERKNMTIASRLNMSAGVDLRFSTTPKSGLVRIDRTITTEVTFEESDEQGS